MTKLSKGLQLFTRLGQVSFNSVALAMIATALISVNSFIIITYLAPAPEYAGAIVTISGVIISLVAALLIVSDIRRDQERAAINELLAATDDIVNTLSEIRAKVS